MLLDGDPCLTLRELAERAGTGLDLARMFWRSMGFADVDPDAVRFTGADVEALRGVAELIDEDDDGAPSPVAPGGGVAASSVLELLRAQSHTMDRLVLWQLETLVADISQRYRLDDTSARLVALDGRTARRFGTSTLRSARASSSSSSASQGQASRPSCG